MHAAHLGIGKVTKDTCACSTFGNWQGDEEYLCLQHIGHAAYCTAKISLSNA